MLQYGALLRRNWLFGGKWYLCRKIQYALPFICAKEPYGQPCICEETLIAMGWLRFVGAFKIKASFAEYRLFHRALLQKSPKILRSLLVVAALYSTHCAPLTATAAATLLCDCTVWICCTNTLKHTHWYTFSLFVTKRAFML